MKDNYDDVEDIGEIVRDIVNDPETTAFTFGTRGPKGGVINYTATDDQDHLIELCAGLLVQFTEDSDKSNKEFVKEVIDEYNIRKKHSIQEKKQYGADSAGVSDQ